MKVFVQAELPAGTPLVDRNVVLWITISETGAVTEVALKQGVGAPFDAAAVAAAKRLVFTPALEGKTPIPVRVPFTYRFRAPKRRGRFVATRRPRRDSEKPRGTRLAGVVLEKGTRRPLAGIAVLLVDTTTGAEVEAVTDDEGRWTAYGLPPGRLQLKIATGEHREVDRRVTGEPTPRGESPPPPEPSLRLFLDPVGLPQYRTVVREKPKAKSATEIHLTEEELTQTPGTFGDPTRVVATLPGVSRSPFGLGYYIVRGASFENTGFFIDGHPALFLYHLLGGPGVIHPELIGELTFYPGGYPVEFGRFATGAIVLDTKNPPDDRWHLDVEIDVLKASGLFSIPFADKKGLITASFRRSYYELLLPLFVDDVELSYTDYQLRVTYAVSRKVQLRLLALGAEDHAFTGPGGNDDPEQTETGLNLGFHRVVADVDVAFSKQVRWENSVAFEFDHNDALRASEDDDTIDVDFTGYVVSTRSGVIYKPLEELELRMGIDALVARVNADLNVPSLPPIGDPRPPSFDPIIVSTNLGATFSSVATYASVDWELTRGLRIIPGVRVTADTYAGGTHWTADPRLAIRFEFVKGWTLTAMGALAHQLPPPFQTEEPFGDPDIPPVQGAQTSLGIEWEPGAGWDIKIEGFYNRIDNMARPTNTVVADDGSIERTLWSADMSARAWGLEVLIRKRFGGRVHGWLSYTLSRSERKRPPGEFELFGQDQTHVLNLAWSVKLGADWSAGARFTLTSGNPFYPIVGSRYDADRDRYEPIYSEDRDRLEVFHRLDIRIDKRWRFDTWMLEAFLDVQNVYNAANPESPRYSFDYAVKTDGAGLPILPTLGVRGVF